MQCPHCLIAIHMEVEEYQPVRDKHGTRMLIWDQCPVCDRLIVILRVEDENNGDELVIFPKAYTRSRVSDDVPEEFQSDYEEAALILADSPKASAALSRRCLQHILREKAGMKGRTLKDEIQKVIDSNTLPSDLIELMTTVRELGNVAAHPTKDKNTGNIVPVEPGEADLCLDVIESLFDHYFVRPARLKRQQQAFQQKLANAKKSSGDTT